MFQIKSILIRVTLPCSRLSICFKIEIIEVYDWQITSIILLELVLLITISTSCLLTLAIIFFASNYS
jgi:hypothetical protein